MAVIPLASIACTIDASGISAPPYADILDTLTAQFQAIFGSDAVLTPDTQPGQWLAILAKAQDSSNAAMILAFNNQSPSTAVGNGLSSVVKINGIKRESPSNSTSEQLIVGEAFTPIVNGMVGDGANTWALPASVIIPFGGSITVTATCMTTGAIQAAADTITRILTPTRGWQSTNNASAATVGAPVEADPQLRQRQTTSTALPSKSIFDGTVGAVENLPGVTKVQPYENDTGTTDGNGIPAHSIAFVVEGGDDTQIAQTILLKKGPGCRTYGSTAVVVLDVNGIEKTIYFSRPVIQTIGVQVNMTALANFVSTSEANVQADVSAFINALMIGQEVYLTQLYAPALRTGQLDYGTFNVTDIQIKLNSGSFGHANIPVGYNGQATCTPAGVTIILS